MKKYVKPLLEKELFATDEFVATCQEANCNVHDKFVLVDGQASFTQWNNYECNNTFVIKSDTEPANNALIKNYPGASSGDRGFAWGKDINKFWDNQVGEDRHAHVGAWVTTNAS